MAKYNLSEERGKAATHDEYNTALAKQRQQFLESLGEADENQRLTFQTIDEMLSETLTDQSNHYLAMQNHGAGGQEALRAIKQDLGINSGNKMELIQTRFDHYSGLEQLGKQQLKKIAEYEDDS